MVISLQTDITPRTFRSRTFCQPDRFQLDNHKLATSVLYAKPITSHSITLLLENQNSVGLLVAVAQLEALKTNKQSVDEKTNLPKKPREPITHFLSPSCISYTIAAHFVRHESELLSAMVIIDERPIVSWRCTENSEREDGRLHFLRRAVLGRNGPLLFTSWER